MTRSAHRRRSVLAVLAAGALLALGAGCGGGDTPAGGDPGGERLGALADDGVFATLPEDATDVETERREAQYREPGFGGGGWDGPAVVVTFTSATAPEEVYAFYERRAEAAGWTPTAAGRLGLTDRWAKTFPDGAPATLSLALLDDASPARTYRLSGGIAPAPG
jgi:hypothetical protein